MRIEQAQRDEARAIANELAKIARSTNVLPGSIQERLTRCGRAGCACQDDPPADTRTLIAPAGVVATRLTVVDSRRLSKHPITSGRIANVKTS